MDRLTGHLQAVLYVARAHWQAAMARLSPPVQAALDWMHAAIQTAIAQTGAALRSVFAVMRPTLQSASDAVGPRWQKIALVAAVAAVVATVVLRVLALVRRRQQVRASLVEVTLDRDPQTAWLDLALVVRNFQPHALIVRNLQVLEPAGTKICERWKAWETIDGSVRFVAPELELTNAADIERTIPPHGAAGHYDDLGDQRHKQRHVDTDELKRSFYLLPPDASAAERINVRAVLHCEIDAGKGRKQRLAFRRTLAHAAASPAALPATL